MDHRNVFKSRAPALSKDSQAFGILLSSPNADSLPILSNEQRGGSEETNTKPDYSIFKKANMPHAKDELVTAVSPNAFFETPDLEDKNDMLASGKVLTSQNYVASLSNSQIFNTNRETFSIEGFDKQLMQPSLLTPGAAVTNSNNLDEKSNEKAVISRMKNAIKLTASASNNGNSSINNSMNGKRNLIDLQGTAGTIATGKKQPAWKQINQILPILFKGGNSNNNNSEKNLQSNLTQMVKLVKLKQKIGETTRQILKKRYFTSNLNIKGGGGTLFHSVLGDRSSNMQESYNNSNSMLSQKILRFLLSGLSKIPTIEPSSKFKLIWDLFIGIIFSFYFFIIPIHIAINAPIHDLITYQAGYIMNVFMGFDVLISMNTGYFDRGVNMSDKKQIIVNYMSRYFWSDVLAQLPLLISELSTEDDSQVQKIFVMLFFVKLRNFQKIFRKLEESFHLSPKLANIISLVKLILTILFFSHIFGCVWIYVGNTQADSEQTWMKKIDIQDQDWTQQYVAAYYFSTVTMITVGYGDINPQNNNERLVSIGTMLISCVIFAYTINQIGTIFSDIFSQDRQMKEFFYIINDYMGTKNINYSLQFRIREYLDFYWREQDQNKSDIEKKIIDSLSDQLREQLMIEANKIVLKDSGIFHNNFNPSIILKMIPIILTFHATPNQVIFNEGQIDDDMFIYFIEKGKIEICRDQFEQPNQAKTVVTLGAGSCFGQWSFLTNLNRREMARSVEFTKLLMVRRSDFLDLVREVPQEFEKFNQLKDSVMLENNLQHLDIKCKACLSTNHEIQHCRYFHYTPDRFVIIQRQNFCTKSQSRDESFQRKKSQFKINSKYSKIRDIVDDLKQNQSQMIEQYQAEYLMMSHVTSEKEFDSDEASNKDFQYNGESDEEIEDSIAPPPPPPIQANLLLRDGGISKSAKNRNTIIKEEDDEEGNTSVNKIFEYSMQHSEDFNRGQDSIRNNDIEYTSDDHDIHNEGKGITSQKQKQENHKQRTSIQVRIDDDEQEKQLMRLSHPSIMLNPTPNTNQEDSPQVELIKRRAAEFKKLTVLTKANPTPLTEAVRNSNLLDLPDTPNQACEESPQLISLNILVPSEKDENLVAKKGIRFNLDHEEISHGTIKFPLHSHQNEQPQKKLEQQQQLKQIKSNKIEGSQADQHTIINKDKSNIKAQPIQPIISQTNNFLDPHSIGSSRRTPPPASALRQKQDNSQQQQQQQQLDSDRIRKKQKHKLFSNANNNPFNESNSNCNSRISLSEQTSFNYEQSTPLVSPLLIDGNFYALKDDLIGNHRSKQTNKYTNSSSLSSVYTFPRSKTEELNLLSENRNTHNNNVHQHMKKSSSHLLAPSAQFGNLLEFTLGEVSPNLDRSIPIHRIPQQTHFEGRLSPSQTLIPLQTQYQQQQLMQFTDEKNPPSSGASQQSQSQIRKKTIRIERNRLTQNLQSQGSNNSNMNMMVDSQTNAYSNYNNNNKYPKSPNPYNQANTMTMALVPSRNSLDSTGKIPLSPFIGTQTSIIPIGGTTRVGTKKKSQVLLERNQEILSPFPKQSLGNLLPKNKQQGYGLAKSIQLGGTGNTTNTTATNAVNMMMQSAAVGSVILPNHPQITSHMLIPTPQANVNPYQQGSHLQSQPYQEEYYEDFFEVEDFDALKIFQFYFPKANFLNIINKYNLIAVSNQNKLNKTRFKKAKITLGKKKISQLS